ncbi:tRNA-specific 2-thiouridylase mnmA [Desulfovibrio sp. X2]|uniref:tRNA 2-thiouridine(34) synthase MnmA n=1 Tax=Desulfovibrio sp. X2 TaxID=941449 RepID=UPI000358A073|nr:tRNA 2-thiouridine(34) synthase MnmA [Desulfovibrio sp. X2]EPR41457.1 tRNA-specific 2-thiouridylase mnmA [Desulfovibrio sp. X2]
MIAVALSGGRDSLLALVLLKEAGHEVCGVHGRFLDDAPGRMPHDELAAELGERCAALGVEFHSLDLREEFARLVVEPFARAYAEGRTPNPCCLCNAQVKFSLLLDRAQGLGASRVATGHYARLEMRGDGEEEEIRLLPGADEGKDQSYFLCLVPKDRLARAIFPLGGWRKERVLAELTRRGLPPPLPRESQEVCFVPGDDYKTFLAGRRHPLPGPGPIVLRDATGSEQVVGRHQGLWRHTEGQRRGIGVAHHDPLYVLAKDSARNALIVGTADLARCRGVRASRLNLLVAPARWPAKVLARTRYRQAPAEAEAIIEGDRLTIVFPTPRSLPAPGQIACLSDDTGRVLAGGIIDEIIPAL